MPGPTYVKTVSKLYVPGETSVSFSHEGRAKDTAVCVLITARGANVTPVSALEYGGLAVPIKESNIRGTEPFPYNGAAFVSGITGGTQIFKCTKHTSVYLVVEVFTLQGKAGVSFGKAGGGSSAGSSTPAVGSMEVAGEALVLAIVTGAWTAFPTARSGTLVTQTNETSSVWDVQESRYSAATTSNPSWTFSESKVNARTGIVLLGAAPEPEPPPEWEDFNGDYSTGNTSQYALVQAPPERPPVVGKVKLYKKFAYSCLYELQVGDPEVASGHRSETESGREFYEGDLAYFRVAINITERDTGAGKWLIPWQLHDQSGSSPPVCLFLEGTKIKLTSGNGEHLFWEGTAAEFGAWDEFIIMVEFGKTGKISLKRNGVVEKMNGGATVLEGVDTYGVGPCYDKNGMYRTGTSEKTAKVYHAAYGVRHTLPFPGEEEEEETVAAYRKPFKSAYGRSRSPFQP